MFLSTVYQLLPASLLLERALCAANIPQHTLLTFKPPVGQLCFFLRLLPFPILFLLSVFCLCSSDQLPCGVRILFAHVFTLLGLRSVFGQGQSCRNTRFLFDWEDFNHVTLLLLLRSRWSVVLVVVCTPFMCHLRCAELYKMCLACGFLGWSISIQFELRQNVHCFLCRGMHLCPWSRDQFHVFLLCEEL